jgi:hypothetical protein
VHSSERAGSSVTSTAEVVSDESARDRARSFLVYRSIRLRRSRRARVDANGRYVAPSSVGTYHVVATFGDGLRPPARATITVVPRELSILAGAAGGRGHLDGVGFDSRLSSVRALAGDGNGHVYIADDDGVGGYAAIRTLDVATGAVTTLVEGATPGPTNLDGAPGTATLTGIGALAVAEDAVYAATYRAIRRIDLATREVTTIAGTLRFEDQLPVDGVGSAARFQSIGGMVLDGKGHLWVTEPQYHAVRRVALATGEVTTVAGKLGEGGTAVGIGGAARFWYPVAIAFDADGSILVSNRDDLRRIEPATLEVSVATARVKGLMQMWLEPEANILFGTNGTLLTSAWGLTRTNTTPSVETIPTNFASPGALVSDGTGNLLLAAPYGSTIGRVAVKTVEDWLSTFDRPRPAFVAVNEIAGAPAQPGSANGVGRAARFNGPSRLALDTNGDLLVIDGNNATLRRVRSSDGTTTTLVGSPGLRALVDGVGGAAQLQSPNALVLDGAGHAYLGDGSTVRRVDLATSTLTTIAGQAGSGPLVRGLAVVDDTLYVAGGTLRTIDLTTGAVSTIYTPPSGSSSELVGVAAIGDQIFVLSVEVRRWSLARVDVASGALSELAAAPVSGVFSGPLSGAITGPVAGADGRLYVADAASHTVLRIDAASGAVSTLVGDRAKRGVRPGALPASVNPPPGSPTHRWRNLHRRRARERRPRRALASALVREAEEHRRAGVDRARDREAVLGRRRLGVARRRQVVDLEGRHEALRQVAPGDMRVHQEHRRSLIGRHLTGDLVGDEARADHAELSADDEMASPERRRDADLGEMRRRVE